MFRQFGNGRRLRLFYGNGQSNCIELRDAREKQLASTPFDSRSRVFCAGYGRAGPVVATWNEWLQFDHDLKLVKRAERSSEGNILELHHAGDMLIGTQWNHPVKGGRFGDTINIALDEKTLEDKVISGQPMADITVIKPNWMLGRTHPSDDVGLWYWGAVPGGKAPNLMQAYQTGKMAAYGYHPSRGLVTVQEDGQCSAHQVSFRQPSSMEF